MDILFAIVIFSAGIVLGIFAQKSLLSPASTTEDTQQKLNQREQELTQYKLDVAEHLDDSAALLKKMNETCQIAMTQMEKSTELLQKATPDATQDELPFFSPETTAELQKTAILRQTKNERTEDVSMTEPPKDYSSEKSGIFSDKKQAVTNS